MLNKKRVLITGGTGSFGKAFVKKILTNYDIKRLVIFSRDELKQYEMSDLSVQLTQQDCITESKAFECGSVYQLSDRVYKSVWFCVNIT